MECEHTRPGSLPEWLSIGGAALLLVSLPLVGSLLTGQPIQHLSEFPPRSLRLVQPPPSAYVLVCSFLVLCLVLAPFVRRAWHVNPRADHTPLHLDSLGAYGLLLLVLSWAVAWSRLELFADIQRHTFFPLWLGYILTVHSLGRSKTGLREFLLLFPLSSAFWWIFEYLNRFLENWSYEGVEDFTPLQYAMLCTLSFSTVLPAVLVTQQLLAGMPRLNAPFAAWRLLVVSPMHRRLVFGLSLLVLGILPLFPNELFPLVWVLPVIVVTTLLEWQGKRTLLGQALDGDWRGTVQWALAALICGWFWEMWNFGSVAKWVYHVPYVGSLHLFEMPLLGFGGYLPFGVLCGTICEAVVGAEHEQQGSENNSQPVARGR